MCSGQAQWLFLYLVLTSHCLCRHVSGEIQNSNPSKPFGYSACAFRRSYFAMSEVLGIVIWSTIRHLSFSPPLPNHTRLLDNVCLPGQSFCISNNSSHQRSRPSLGIKKVIAVEVGVRMCRCQGSLICPRVSPLTYSWFLAQSGVPKGQSGRLSSSPATSQMPGSSESSS